MMDSYICTTCKKIKFLSEFGKSRSRKGGREPRCKVCAGDNLRNYHRTKKGVANKIHQAQKCNSKKRGHPPPTYTLDELREWLFKDPAFNEIYESWVESGYEKNKAPSCDRIDNKKSYSFNNIQLITWGENFKRWIKEVKATGGRAGRKVSQLTLNGEFIKTYLSIRLAARVTGVDNSSIVRCCKAKYKNAGGFIWKYNL